MFARSLLRTGVRPFTTTAVRQDRAGNSVAISISELDWERTLTLPSLVAPPHSSPVPTLPFSRAFVFVFVPFPLLSPSFLLSDSPLPFAFVPALFPSLLVLLSPFLQWRRPMGCWTWCPATRS